ncbi:hypothetical protein [Kitasatospora purpeofusca]|uniref:hypothetical protein n=1 Tax=Kitasatospora purpeofusca TaxID=67352 RepID=UPI00386493C1|nr:hypothetical protein OIP63_28985 [Kitasatospora purpeofusca]
MIWWCKARAVPLLVAVLAGTVATGLLLGDGELPVPALHGQAGHFLLAHVITLLPAVFLLYGLGRGDLRTETVAGRFLRGLDVGLALTLAAAGATCGSLAYAAGQGALALVVARNIAGYLGLALLFHPLIGHRPAAAALAAVPLVCSAAGWHPDGSPRPWAWPLHPAGSPYALAAVALLLLAGAGCALFRRHPTTGPHGLTG